MVSPKLGTELCQDDQREVLHSYVNRYTGEHRPQWVASSTDPVPLHFADDADWLAHTLFDVRKDGRLDRRAKYCQSSPTWPHNPELRR